jgi:hypothetical protein
MPRPAVTLLGPMLVLSHEDNVFAFAMPVG